MADAVRPSLFTVPMGHDLCDAAVSAIFERIGKAPLALNQAIIFLPNNRAIRSMTDAFVRRAQPGLLLPQMVAVGDLALDEALAPVFDPLDGTAEIPAAIEPMQRLLLLAKLVKDNHAIAGRPVNANEALRLGRYLAEVVDELEIEQIRFGRFKDIEPGGDLAGHWQNSFAHLQNLVPRYHAELEKLNKLGPAARRNLLLEQLSRTLRASSPEHLIAAIGVSTAAPAIAGLLRSIALLPNSMVILPATDTEMQESQWERIGSIGQSDGLPAAIASKETHPQFHLKLLLDRMGFRRDEITILGKSNVSVNSAVSAIFSLAENTVDWRELSTNKKKLPHIRLLTAQDSAEEARAIAVLVRGALETPQKRIAIITPDRELGLRVSAQLKRWKIDVDDSAGSALILSPSGSLFMALAHAMANQFAPVSLLSVLKHPLVMAGEARLGWLEKVRLLDVILRGPNAGIGLAAITRRIDVWQATQLKNHREIDPEFASWWAGVQNQLSDLNTGNSGMLADILGTLQAIVDNFSGGAIWRGEAGRQLSAFVEELNGQNLSVLGPIDREGIVALFTELLNNQTVRMPYGGHPRVAIYGLLEARLQQSDLVICAGLNEGTWPQLAGPDPWLAPRIRAELGLPGLERNIGLSAHDMATALGAGEVVLTRAERDRSGPTVASRFVLRIQAFLGANLAIDQTATLAARKLDRPEAWIKLDRPAPLPSQEQREKVVLSVTDFDRLLADPFAFYAGKILRIKTLDPVDAEPSHAWRGSIVHDILEQWAKEDKCDPAKLMARAGELLTNPALHPALRTLWQPRIAQGLQWVAQRTSELSVQGRNLLVAEQAVKGEIEGIKLHGRADRIDQLPGGGIAIVDYKTGKAPTDKSVTSGFALQLGLIGFLVETGGIENVSGTAEAFEYWSLAKKDGKFGSVSTPVSDTVKNNKKLTNEFVVFAHEKASAAIHKWIIGMAPFTAKLHPEYAPYAEFDQLMRYEEWNGREPLSDGEGQ
jgi:ATP-dependent helicase/nuclease subunit B